MAGEGSARTPGPAPLRPVGGYLDRLAMLLSQYQPTARPGAPSGDRFATALLGGLARGFSGSRLADLQTREEAIAAAKEEQQRRKKMADDLVDFMARQKYLADLKPPKQEAPPKPKMGNYYDAKSGNMVYGELKPGAITQRPPTPKTPAGPKSTLPTTPSQLRASANFAAKLAGKAYEQRITQLKGKIKQYELAGQWDQASPLQDTLTRVVMQQQQAAQDALSRQLRAGTANPDSVAHVAQRATVMNAIQFADSPEALDAVEIPQAFVGDQGIEGLVMAKKASFQNAVGR